jgi:hypothetical protein
MYWVKVAHERAKKNLTSSKVDGTNYPSRAAVKPRYRICGDDLIAGWHPVLI